MPRERRSPKESRHVTTRQTRGPKRRERDTTPDIPTHAMVTRSRSRDKDNKIVFTQLTDDPPKKQRKQPVEKKKTTKTATKTSERRKENVAVSNKAPQSSDEEDAPEEPPPKAKETATLKASQRTLPPPVSHTLSPKRRDRPKSLQSPGSRSPEIPTAPQVPGPSNASSPPRRDDVIGELERSPTFSVKLPKQSRVALEKRQTTKPSEGKGGKLTVPVDQQSSDEDHELNTSTLRVPPRSPVHPPSSPMPENRAELRRSPRIRLPETSTATQVPGSSNASSAKRNDVIRGLERSSTFSVKLPKQSRVALEKKQTTKPSEGKGGKLTVPVDQQSSDEDHELNTSTLRVPPRSPVHPPSSPMPENRAELRRSPRIRLPETSTATQVPGSSNASSAKRNDVIRGLEISPTFSVKLPKHSRVALEKRQTTKPSEGQGGKLTVPVDQQSSDEDHELSTSTLRVPPRSPVHHPSSPMPENRAELRRSPRIRIPETSTATQVPGSSNASSAKRNDVIRGLERSPTFYVDSSKHSRVALEKKKTTKPSEGKGGKLTVPVDQQSSDEDHELNTSTVRVPPRSLVHPPSSPMPENRPELRRSPRIRLPETSTATQVPGPSNTSGAVGTDDETEELEEPRRVFTKSSKNRQIPIYFQEKQRAKTTNNKTGSTQIRPPKIPAAPGPSDAPDPVEIDDENGFRGFEDRLEYPMELQREKIVQEKRRKIIKPATETSENRRDLRDVPVYHLRSSKVHASAAPSPAAKKTVTLKVPVHHSIFSPIRGMTAPIRHDRLEPPLMSTPAAGLFAPSTHDSMEIDDGVEEQPREAAEAENNLPFVKSEPDSPNLQFESGEIIELSSTSSDSSPDFHNSRSMYNVTLRRDKSTVPCVSNAVLLPHRTSNWTQVEIGFRYECSTINDLKKSVAMYNHRAGDGEFKGLNYVLSEMFAPEMRLKFYEEFRPKVMSLALQLPTLMREKSIPMLKCNESSSLTLSRGQIACILANAFFCTFSEDSAGESVNFSQLFQTFEDDAESELNQIIGEKLKCIMEYFWSISKDAKDLVIFRRFKLTSREQLPWEMVTNEAQNIEVNKEPQRLHENSVLIVFTNASIGGGVFGFEAGTEEICFLTHPELLVLRLLAEPLRDNEALFVSNVQQFCKSQGSADSFRYASRIQKTSRNIIIMKWKGFDWPRQFSFNMEEFMREVNRIDSALGGIPPEILKRVDVIEGGLAGDDYPEIEFLLMIMIASKYEHRLNFFTHDDKVKQEILLTILGEQAKGEVNAAKIYKALRKYDDKYGDAEEKPRFCFWLKLELLKNRR